NACFNVESIGPDPRRPARDQLGHAYQRTSIRAVGPGDERIHTRILKSEPSWIELRSAAACRKRIAGRGAAASAGRRRTYRLDRSYLKPDALLRRILSQRLLQEREMRLYMSAPCDLLRHGKRFHLWVSRYLLAGPEFLLGCTLLHMDFAL